ncbi:MAG: LysR family transcriptional regulator [Tagaea sp.]|nr:LysR family transcriptional regulator [Tagaea sp.]
MRSDALDGLLAFALVAERRNFTAAAAELRVTRSAVSQSIKTLERRLGVALFARTTRDVGLTEAGRVFYEGVRPAIDGVVAASEKVGGLGGKPSGLLRLNVPRVAIAGVIAPLLPAFRAAYPGVTVEVFADDGLANIVEDGFDAGVRLGELVEKDMVSIRLAPDDRLIAIGAPAYFARHGHPAHPRDLAAHACINFRQPTRKGLYRWEFERDGETFDVAVEGALIVNDTELKMRATLDGMGLSYELESVAAPHLKAGKLVATLADYAPRVPGFHLYFPARAQAMPKLRAFIDIATRARAKRASSQAN